MKDRNFIDPVTSDNSTLPWSREDALKNGYARWMDRDGCSRCKAEGRSDGKKARYLKDDSCSFCMSIDANNLWPLWLQGEPSRPSPWTTSAAESLALNLDWYYGSPSHPVLCPKGPHLRKTSMSTGRCVECEKDAAHFRALSKGPRAIARSSGERYYTPTEACVTCGKVAPRHVVTNGCTGCHNQAKATTAAYDGRRSPSQLFAEENPDFIIPREAARSLGFTLYRTGEQCRRGHAGWRYVSTGNCLMCIKGD